MSIVLYNNVYLQQHGINVLDAVNLKIEQGEMIYLTGRVGSGKTTLLKSMYAAIPVASGQASVLGFDMNDMRQKGVYKLRRQLGIVFQDFRLLTDRNVVDNLRFVLKATGWHDNHQMDLRIEQTLQLVSMTHKAYSMPHHLSGGEQQRVAIARAILNEPKLILADEPTGNLDPTTSVQILSLLRSLTENKITVIMATHNQQLVQQYPARTLHCEANNLK